MGLQRLVLFGRHEALGWTLRRAAPLLAILAYVWRRALPRTTFIAVTGSLGKTTAKECLAAALESVAPTVRSRGNQNNGALLWRNLLRVRPWHRFAVLEIGVDRPGTMAAAAAIIRPSVVVVLNVSRTHCDHFRDLEEHAAEKEVLLRALPPDGIAVVNDDDGRVASMATRARCRVVRFGSSASADVRVEGAEARWPDRLALAVVTAAGERAEVRTRLVGEHWLGSVAGALATAWALGVPPATAAVALQGVEPVAGRLRPVRVPSGAVILRDDYNGSVDTALAAFEVLRTARAERRVLVLTDISDLEGHVPHRRRLVADAAARAADALVLVGEFADFGRRRAISAGMKAEAAHAFASLEEAASFLASELREGDVVLLKGRTTDHAGRLALAQLGPIGCWVSHCTPRRWCDSCWRLGLSEEQLGRATVVPPGR